MIESFLAVISYWTTRKDFKVYGIKIVRIFLGSYRIPNMVLQMSSVLG